MNDNKQTKKNTNETNMKI